MKPIRFEWRTLSAPLVKKIKKRMASDGFTSFQALCTHLIMKWLGEK